MPAPQRLKIGLGPKQISAFISPVSYQDTNYRAACPTCAPLQTKMKWIASVELYEGEVTRHFDVWRCHKCLSAWALERLPKEELA